MQTPEGTSKKQEKEVMNFYIQIKWKNKKMNEFTYIKDNNLL